MLYAGEVQKMCIAIINIFRSDRTTATRYFTCFFSHSDSRSFKRGIKNISLVHHNVGTVESFRQLLHKKNSYTNYYIHSNTMRIVGTEQWFNDNLLHSFVHVRYACTSQSLTQDEIGKVCLDMLIATAPGAFLFQAQWHIPFTHTVQTRMRLQLLVFTNIK